MRKELKGLLFFAGLLWWATVAVAVYQHSWGVIAGLLIGTFTIATVDYIKEYKNFEK